MAVLNMAATTDTNQKLKEAKFEFSWKIYTVIIEFENNISSLIHYVGHSKYIFRRKASTVVQTYINRKEWQEYIYIYIDIYLNT